MIIDQGSGIRYGEWQVVSAFACMHTLHSAPCKRIARGGSKRVARGVARWRDKVKVVVRNDQGYQEI